MRMKLPEHVNRIIHRLQKEGYDAYAVGGCVRDTLLGREPKDWDITTSARPEAVKSLFSHTIDTGIQLLSADIRICRFTGLLRRAFVAA